MHAHVTSTVSLSSTPSSKPASTQRRRPPLPKVGTPTQSHHQRHPRDGRRQQREAVQRRRTSCQTSHPARSSGLASPIYPIPAPKLNVTTVVTSRTPGQECQGRWLRALCLMSTTCPVRHHSSNDTTGPAIPHAYEPFTDTPQTCMPTQCVWHRQPHQYVRSKCRHAVERDPVQSDERWGKCP